jgi:hypothetical protein
LTCLIRLNQPCDLRELEYSPLLHRLCSQQILHHRLEVANEPCPDRPAEATLRRQTTSCGSTDSKLRLKMHFRVSRRSFSLGELLAVSCGISSSTSGTRTSVDAAMLILSM